MTDPLACLTERLTAVDIPVRRRSVYVRFKAPGSIRTGCYHHVKVRTAPAVEWTVDGRRFVAFVDVRGIIRYRELWKHHEPPFELDAARKPNEVLFIPAGWQRPAGCNGRWNTAEKAFLHFGPCKVHDQKAAE